MSEEITFNTTYYEAVHDGLPHHSSKQDWSFMPPSHCGRRPWQFVNMTLKQAKQAAIDEIGERGKFGTFVVIP